MSAPYGGGQYGGAVGGGAAGMDVQGGGAGGMAPVMAPQGVTYLCGGACARACVRAMRAQADGFEVDRWVVFGWTDGTQSPHASEFGHTDCGAQNVIKNKDPIRCRQCNHRIMYKMRTKRGKEQQPLFFPVMLCSLCLLCCFLASSALR